VAIQKIYNPFLSDYQKYENETFIDGTLAAPMIDRVTVSEIPPYHFHALPNQTKTGRKKR